MTLPDTAFAGDLGHIVDHNLIVTSLSGKLDATTASTTYAAVFVVPAPTGVAATDTAAVQAAIDAAAAAGGGLVSLRRGTYVVSALTLKDGVTLEGAGKFVTTLRAASGAVSGTGLLSLAAGPVRANIRHLGVEGLGATNLGQHGIYFRSAASAGAPFHGGWWNSEINDIVVRDFHGHNIWLRGGGTSFLLPHQFLTLKNIMCLKNAASAGTSGVRMTGQVAQVEVIGGEYNGPAQSNDGTNIVLGREVDDSGAVVSDVAPAIIAFRGASMQDNKRGITVSRAFPVLLDGCWLENLSEGVTASDSAVRVTVRGSFLTNVGSNAGAGFSIKAASSSTVVADGNVFSGASDVNLLASFGSIISRDNVNANGTKPTTSGLTVQVGVEAAGLVTLGDYRTAIVNSSATQIINVASTASVGEKVSIKAFGGTLVLNSTGSINASGLAMPFTVPANAIVTLVRHDLGSDWNIEGITP